MRRETQLGLVLWVFFGVFTVTLLGIPSEAPAQQVIPPQPIELDPRYIEREVEFLWTEGGKLWKDEFNARLYPRHPRVGDTVRIRLKIKRKREGRSRKGPSPQTVVATVRRKAGGGEKIYEANEPGSLASFEHTFTRTGRHSIAIVTYYSEHETYTVTLHCTVEKPKPVEPPGDETVEPAP